MGNFSHSLLRCSPCPSPPGPTLGDGLCGLTLTALCPRRSFKVVCTAGRPLSALDDGALLPRDRRQFADCIKVGPACSLLPVREDQGSSAATRPHDGLTTGVASPGAGRVSPATWGAQNSCEHDPHSVASHSFIGSQAACPGSDFQSVQLCGFRVRAVQFGTSLSPGEEPCPVTGPPCASPRAPRPPPASTSLPVSDTSCERNHAACGLWDLASFT